jgi:type IV pilus assembly protein PilA
MFQSVLQRLRDAQNVELEDGAPVEAGFTLIELMVVLLIIAILLAIAIPTFLGVTGSANDRAAQSNLTNALTEAAAVYQGNSQSFLGISAALTSSAPEFTWTAAASTATPGTNVISVEPVDVNSANDQQGVVLAAESKNNSTCWWTVQLSATPAVIGSGETGSDVAFEATASSQYSETGATTAGTYYAKLANAGSKCTAAYATGGSGDAAAFNWGTSYSSPGTA